MSAGTTAGREAPVSLSTPSTAQPGLLFRFRHWRRSRPFWAGIWALIGGALIWFLPLKAVQFVFVTPTPIWAGILVGVLIDLFAILLWIQPANRILLGTLIVVFSLVSFVTSNFGGFFLGMLFGIFGGALALSWVPVKGTTERQRRWLAKGGETPAPAAPPAAAPAPAANPTSEPQAEAEPQPQPEPARVP